MQKFPIKCEFDGVIIKNLHKITDQRGWLAELYRQDELNENLHPVMAYVSSTKPGTSRGPHEHRGQSDIFCFIGTSVFRIYLWDNRRDSSTYGRKCVFETEPDKITLVIVPPGIVHAYKNIGKNNGLVFNAPNRLYAGKGKKHALDEIRYENDKESPFKLDN